MNQLLLGDNLEILKSLESDRIDLIYLDPPFFSNRNYEVIWGDAGEIRSFQDRWSGGIDHYIAWLKERVVEMHRLLKPTGSLFLHCDWHANAYIRVYVLDKVFGEQNFRNEIIWHYSGWNAKLKDSFNKRYDSIFFYSKSNKSRFNGFTEKWQSEEEYIKLRKQKVHLDENGRKYVLSDGGNGKRVNRFLDEAIAYGKPVSDVWIFDKLNNSAKEAIGYPTQKPEALLERIILCASNEGDTVLDPFVGGGTTVAVADRFKRQWLGIDQSVQAIKVSEMRLQKQQDLFSQPFIVKLHKYDYDTLRYSNAFDFETWIIQQYGGRANTKQRGDLGLDGRTPEGLPIQVKRSDGVGRNIIDNFQSACRRFDHALFERNQASKLPVGILIAFSFGKGAIQEVARLQNEENTILQLLRVEDIVPMAKKPKLSVKFTDLGLDSKGLREIELVAQGESDAGIEFYAWDFSYTPLLSPLGKGGDGGFKADVLIDKTGTQTAKFKAGSHVIAVKVVDNEGLESLEVMALKINGEVK